MAGKNDHTEQLAFVGHSVHNSKVNLTVNFKIREGDPGKAAVAIASILYLIT